MERRDRGIKMKGREWEPERMKERERAKDKGRGRWKG